MPTKWRFRRVVAKQRVNHVFIRNAPDHLGLIGYELLCTHCGATYKPSLPCEIDVFLATAEAFMKNHRDCPARPEPGDQERR